MYWKTSGIIALCLACVLTLHAEEKPEALADAEPPLQMQVLIGGKTVAAEAGRTMEVEVEGKKLSLRIDLLPHRLFDRGGVRFLYPTSHGWEVDRTTPNVTIYTMDGNDTIIMLVKYDVEITPKKASDSMVSTLSGRYGQGNVKRVGATLKGKTETVQGTRLQVNVVGQAIEQDIYGFDAGGVTFTLMLQASMDDQGKPPKEMAEVRELFAKSFEFPTAAAK